MNDQALKPDPYWPDWLALLIALIALIQPWIVALWKRLYRRASVEVVVGGRIEIGFAASGPTVALMGTARALNESAFVTDVIVTVCREGRGGASDTRRLPWLVFRSFDMFVDKPHSLQMALPVVIPRDADHRFNIHFADSDAIKNHVATIENVRSQWARFKEDQRKLLKRDLLFAELIHRDLTDQELVNSYEVFRGRPEARALAEKLSEEFFWRDGEYRLEMSWRVSGGNAIVRRWKVTIGVDDAAVLRKNIDAAIRDLCNIQAEYTFVYKDYSDP